MADFFMNLTNGTGINSTEISTGAVAFAVTAFFPIIYFLVGIGIGYLIGRRRRIIRRIYPEKSDLMFEYYQGRKDQIEGKPDKYQRNRK